MKRLNINLTDEEYDFLRKDAFDNNESMSALLKGSYFNYNSQGIVPKSATSIKLEGSDRLSSQNRQKEVSRTDEAPPVKKSVASLSELPFSKKKQVGR